MRARRKDDVRALAKRLVADCAARSGAARSPHWQDLLVEALTRGCTITRAARAAGISRASAYRARTRDCSFAARWDAALRTPQPMSALPPFARRVPLFYGGRQVGERIDHDNGALIGTLRRALR